MGFSAKFKLERGTRRERIKILGNGVCPPVLEAVVRNLAKEELRELRFEGGLRALLCRWPFSTVNSRTATP